MVETEVERKSDFNESICKVCKDAIRRRTRKSDQAYWFCAPIGRSCENAFELCKRYKEQSIKK
jgi:hypothetical protein